MKHLSLFLAGLAALAMFGGAWVFNAADPPKRVVRNIPTTTTIPTTPPVYETTTTTTSPPPTTTTIPVASSCTTTPPTTSAYYDPNDARLLREACERREAIMNGEITVSYPSPLELRIRALEEKAECLEEQATGFNRICS